jgi:multiple sugar transport system substrate-binding protein
MAKLLNLAVGAALAALATTPSAHAAEKITLEVVHAWGGHKRFHEPIAEAFMKAHPDIEIKFRAPMKSYADGHQAILREALSENLPDIWFSPYNTLGELVATLQPRGQITELTPFVAAEGPEWASANYAPNVLGLGQVDGKQWGIPFNASTPIVYYNLDLIQLGGGSAEDPPDTWDEIITTGAKLGAARDDVDGVAYSVSEWDDDWLWQALVYNEGGQMMDAGKKEIAFGGEEGLKAVTLLHRLAQETKMPLLTEDQSIQQFAAGKLGIFFGSTAEVRVMGELVGDKFKWKTGPYPIADKAKGGLPTGGNVGVILSADEARKKAAWEYIKFATGPEGQKIAVLGSGYMPTNLKASEPAYLGTFYEEHPDWTTSMKQWPVARLWFGYPGNTGVKIWREQKTILASIIRGEVSPEEGLKQMVVATDKLVRE